MSTIGIGHFKLLAIFCTVMERGSFAAAARKLGSSRSRVSEQLSQLEADLGVRLIQRSTRQLKITAEGQQVYERAKALPALLANIEAIVQPEQPTGAVSITMNHDIGHLFVLPLLADFKRLYPSVELNLVLDDNKLDLIAEQLDLGIRIGFLNDDSLIARVMHREQPRLFASPGFIAEHKMPTSLDSLSQKPWVALSAHIENNYLKLWHKGQTVQCKPKDMYRCNSPLMLQKMVLQGLGVGLLLPTTVREEIKRGDLIPVMPTMHAQELVFSLVYPSRKQVASRTRVLIDYLLQSQLFNELGKPV